MTENEWLTCSDPLPMLQFIAKRRPERSKEGRRKLRLYACACCRAHWSKLSEHSRQALEITEQYADGRASRKEFGYAQRIATYDFAGQRPESFAEGVSRYTYDGALNWVTSSAATAAYCVGHHFTTIARRESPEREFSELSRQADLVRELFGNPFMRVDPRWMDWGDDVITLANAIYSDRRFREMPALAAMLHAAGCESAAVLAHCRGEHQHVRGCWVLDLLLGRTAQGRDYERLST